MMTKKLEIMIGQMFMLGIDGTGPSREIEEIFQTIRPGGVLLLGKNCESPKQVSELTGYLKGLSRDVPLLVAVDQEGGRVNRLKEPFTQFPSPGELGRTGNDIYVYRVGLAQGRELAAVGINMNLAPVLDVNINPRNTVIGDRSFGEDPAWVAKLGTAYMHGLKNAGVIATGKHFPGHGDTAIDSHLDLPRVEADRSRLERVELRPFRQAIEEEVPALLTAHVLYKALDPNSPATLSHKIVTGMLKERMKFPGLVLSDDLKMGAISAHHSIDEAAILATLAGVDMLVISKDKWEYEKVWRAVTRAVKEKRINEERLYQALRRVLGLKKRLVNSSQPELKEVGSEENQRLLYTILSARRLPPGPKPTAFS